MTQEQVEDWRGDPMSVMTEEGARIYSAHFSVTKYHSVTTIIRRIYGDLFKDVPEGQLDYARRVGIETHRAIKYLSRAVQDGLDWDGLDPEVEPKVIAFDEWMREERWVPVHVEQCFYDDELRLAGTPDQVGYFSDGYAREVVENNRGLPDFIENRLWIADWKPKVAKLVGLQLAGYAMLVKKCLGLNYVPGRLSLHLDKDRVHRQKEYKKHARDRNAFISCLNAHAYGIEEGVWAA